MSEATATLDDYRWLVGPEGERWLRRIAEDDREPLVLAGMLRRELSAERTHLILEQTELRRRARRKFVDADRMLFTRVGLEQATDEVVATLKADRFPADRQRVDLCCGIGGDLLAMAAVGPTLGVDRDRVVALLATENLRRLGREPSWVVVADVDHFAVDAASAWHVDPDRRPKGRRSVQLRWHSPDQAAIERLRARAADGVVKLAPAAEVPDAWQYEAELEWISRDGQCRQQLVWFGDLARTPGRRRATVVRGEPGGSPEVRTLVGTPAVSVAMAERVRRYVFEPDAAVLAADLTGVLVAEHALEAIAPGAVYLTSDRPIADSAMACFEVDVVLPFDQRRVKHLLAARGLGRLEIKTRGLPHDPDCLRRALRVQGDTAGVLLLARHGRGVMAIVARRQGGPSAASPTKRSWWGSAADRM